MPNPRYPFPMTAQVRFADRPPIRDLHNYSTLPNAMTAMPLWFANLVNRYPDAIRIAVTLRLPNGNVAAKLRYGIEVPSMEGV